MEWMCGVRGVYFSILIYILGLSRAELSSHRFCTNLKCDVPVSRGVALSRYAPTERGMVGLNTNDKVTIYSHPAGSNPDLLGVEVNGIRGYVPKNFIQETEQLNWAAEMVEIEEWFRTPPSVQIPRVKPPYSAGWSPGASHPRPRPHDWHHKYMKSLLEKRERQQQQMHEPHQQQWQQHPQQMQQQQNQPYQPPHLHQTQLNQQQLHPQQMQQQQQHIPPLHQQTQQQLHQHQQHQKPMESAIHDQRATLTLGLGQHQTTPPAPHSPQQEPAPAANAATYRPAEQLLWERPQLPLPAAELDASSGHRSMLGTVGGVAAAEQSAASPTPAAVIQPVQAVNVPTTHQPPQNINVEVPLAQSITQPPHFTAPSPVQKPTAAGDAQVTSDPQQPAPSIDHSSEAERPTDDEPTKQENPQARPTDAEITSPSANSPQASSHDENPVWQSSAPQSSEETSPDMVSSNNTDYKDVPSEATSPSANPPQASSHDENPAWQSLAPQYSEEPSPGMLSSNNTDYKDVPASESAGKVSPDDDFNSDNDTEPLNSDQQSVETGQVVDLPVTQAQANFQEMQPVNEEVMIPPLEINKHQPVPNYNDGTHKLATPEEPVTPDQAVKSEQPDVPEKVLYPEMVPDPPAMLDGTPDQSTTSEATPGHPKIADDVPQQTSMPDKPVMGQSVMLEQKVPEQTAPSSKPATEAVGDATSPPSEDQPLAPTTETTNLYTTGVPRLASLDTHSDTGSPPPPTPDVQPTSAEPEASDSTQPQLAEQSPADVQETAAEYATPEKDTIYTPPDEQTTQQSTYADSAYGGSVYGKSAYGDSVYGESAYGKSVYGDSGIGPSTYGESSYATTDSPGLVEEVAAGLLPSSIWALLEGFSGDHSTEPLTENGSVRLSVLLSSIGISLAVLIIGMRFVAQLQHEGALKQTISKLHQRLTVHQEEISVLKTDLETRSKQASDAGSAAQLQTALQAAAADQAAAEDELEDSRHQVDELNKQVAALEQELAQAQTMLEEQMIKQSQPSSPPIDSMVVETVAKLDAELKQQRKKLMGENEKLKRDKKRLAEELAHTKPIVRQLEEKLTAIGNNKVSAEEEARNRKQIEELTQKQEEMCRKCAALTAERDTATENVSALESDVAEARRLHHASQEQVDTLTAEVDTLKTLLSNLEQGADNGSEEKIQTLLEGGKLKAQVEKLTKERAKLKEKWKQERELLKKAQANVEEKSTELTQLSERCEKAEVDRFEAESKLDHLEKYFQKKEVAFQQEIGVLKSRLSLTEGDNTSSHDLVQRLSEEVTQYKTLIDSLKQEIQDQERSFRSQIQALEKRSHESWVTCRQAERRLEEANREAAQYRALLTKTEEEKHNLVNGQAALQCASFLPPPPPPPALDPFLPAPLPPMSDSFLPAPPPPLPPPDGHYEDFSPPGGRYRDGAESPLSDRSHRSERGYASSGRRGAGRDWSPPRLSRSSYSPERLSDRELSPDPRHRRRPLPRYVGGYPAEMTGPKTSSPLVDEYGRPPQDKRKSNYPRV